MKKKKKKQSKNKPEKIKQIQSIVNQVKAYYRKTRTIVRFQHPQ